MGRWIAVAVLVILGVLTLAAGAGFALLHLDLSGLPSTEGLLKVAPPFAARIYCVDGTELARLFEENRVTVPLDQMSPALTQAVVAVEDQKFWHHWGIDLFGVTRALLADLAAGRFVQGGSTITQQLARSLFLTPEVSVTRKIKEALMALRIERAFSKEEILALYLNQVYFGEGAYGAEVAAEVYFGRSARDLTLGESAMLAGLLKSPAGYSPRHHPDRALGRRQLVLRMMRETGAITADEAEEAAAEPLAIVPRKRNYRLAPYFVDRVRQDLEESYGSELVYRGGLRVYTTLDPVLQEAAETALANGLAEREKQIPRLARGLPERVREAAGGGVNTPYLQGALVALDPSTGTVRAMVGGRDFYDSNFNRALQAQRQPGSSFKLFVYAAALESGYQPGSILVDEPIAIPLPDQPSWRPQNYDPDYAGRVTLREALAHSINIPAVEVFMDVGGDHVIDCARRLGITTPIPNLPSIALGSADVTLMEMTSAYAAVANQGALAKPVYLLRVEDASGRILDEATPALSQALAPETAYVLADLLSSVVDRGTGNRARQLGLDGPAEGKTGTTNDFTDAWFLGSVPGLTAGVWVGFDLKWSMGSKQSGGVVALPIWTEFMKTAVRVLPPVEPQAPPAGVIRIPICTVSGMPAGPNCPQTRDELAPSSVLDRGTCLYHQRSGRKEAAMPPWREATARGSRPH